MPQINPARMSNLFQLEYPQSVGVYQTYEQAQKVVDYLADQKFPVENLCIVGTELRSVERVLGRRTWGTVLAGGLQNGISTGLIFGILMMLLVPEASTNPLALVGYALGIGVLVGVVMAVALYLASRGKRDFTSVSQTVATKYELLAEHKVAVEARGLVSRMPGAWAAMFAPSAPVASAPVAPASVAPRPQYPWVGEPTSPPPPVVPTGLAPAQPISPTQPSTATQPPATQLGTTQPAAPPVPAHPAAEPTPDAATPGSVPIDKDEPQS
jgi:hypothetical protein